MPGLRPILSLLAILLLFQPSEAPARPDREPDLVIVHTNDLHARYRPFESRDGESRGGFARIAGAIAELRERHGDRLIYMDAGDLFQGTPFYHFYRGELGMRLLDAMACDAFALGNHELDDGHENFLRASSEAAFPLLCANLFLPDASPLLPASTRLHHGGFTIDVVGLITAELDEVTGVVTRGELLLEDPALALRRWLDARPDAADLTLLLSHCGLEEDLLIAAEVPGLPIVISGHSHHFLDEPELVDETLICTTGAYGYNLGKLMLWRESGRWEMEHELIPVDDNLPENPMIRAMIEEAAVIVDREMAVEVGSLAGNFNMDDKSSRPNPLGQMVAELMRQEAGTDIGLQNVGGYRISLPAGPITRGDIFTLLPFDNRIVRIIFRGEILRELFDYLAANHDTGRFAQISGASYRIEGGRAVEILIGGKPLDPEAVYSVATLDFLYGGGDGFTVLARSQKAVVLDAFPRDVMEAWLKAGNIPSPADFAPNFVVE